MRVEQILHEIDSLSERDRLKLERELSRRLEAEWEQESRKARKEARRRGIDQKTIDGAISRRRHRR